MMQPSLKIRMRSAKRENIRRRAGGNHVQHDFYVPYGICNFLYVIFKPFLPAPAHKGIGGNLLLDSDNMIIMAKTKHAVFTIAFRLKNGISELLTVKSSNLHFP